MKAEIRVLLADGDELCRAACRQMLSDRSEVAIVAEAVDSEDLYQKYNEHKPDVVIMELMFPNCSGLDVARRILAKDSKARLLALTRHDNESFFNRAIETGILGYVTKCAPLNEAVDGVRRVAAGEIFIGQKMLPLVLRQGLSQEHDLIGKLSSREFEVFQLLAEGDSIDDVASALNLSPKTVRHHYASIKRKLDVDNRAWLTRLAIRFGVITA